MDQTKTCTKCGMTKPISAFPWGKDSRLLAGGSYKAECKSCATERAKKWQKENYARASVTQKTWRTENRARWNEYMREPSLRYVNARKKQTPKWADHDKIAEVYAQSASLRALGVDCEVDHIIPLQGRTARGLHVHYNLRIVLKTDNAKKRNSVDPNAYSIPSGVEK